LTYYRGLRFVETTTFTRQVSALLGDEEYQALQNALALCPECGPVIKGTGGVRKAFGKRGGLRAIYYWSPDGELFYMLALYAKSAQDDLTPGQLKGIRQAVEEEFG
jgi:hypothetical protein